MSEDEFHFLIFILVVLFFGSLIYFIWAAPLWAIIAVFLLWLK